MAPMGHSIDQNIVAAVTTMLCVGSPAVIATEAHSYLQAKNFLYAGGFWQDGELTVESRRGDAGLAAIELDNLGVNREYASWMIDYHRRVSNRWKISASIYRYSDGRLGQLLKDDIAWEGQDFSAGIDVGVDWKIDTLIIDAMYTVKRADNFELALGGGVHALDTELVIRGQGVINGGDNGSQGSGETARGSLVVPLPNLRATGFYALNKKWSAQATLGWLSLSIDEYDGSFKYAHLRGQYQISNTLGLSLGYQLVEIDVEEQIRLGSRRFDMSFQGVTAALTFAF
jgi:hypothetical protein